MAGANLLAAIITLGLLIVFGVGVLVAMTSMFGAALDPKHQEALEKSDLPEFQKGVVQGAHASVLIIFALAAFGLMAAVVALVLG